MSVHPCRWGILSTASISRKNWKAIWHSENATLTAVASRDIHRAQSYIDELQSFAPFDPAPSALGSYEEILARDDVDAVYIPLPTGLRKPWVFRAAEAGKHVLCEKPCGATVNDVKEMIAACEKNNVQFMDGVMFMHTDRLKKMRTALDVEENVGDIKRIVSHFSFNGGDDWAKQNIRTSSDLEPLGCLGDLGWYNLRLTLWAMNWQMPKQVSGRMLTEFIRNEDHAPVPIEFSGEMLFEGGASAVYYCSFITELQQWGIIGGTNGYLHINDFVLPYFGSRTDFELRKSNFDVVGCDFNMENRTSIIPTNEHGSSNVSAQETKMIRCFSELVRNGKPDPHWPEIALKTQIVLEACLQSAKEGGKLLDL